MTPRFGKSLATSFLFEFFRGTLVVSGDTVNVVYSTQSGTQVRFLPPELLEIALDWRVTSTSLFITPMLIQQKLLTPENYNADSLDIQYLIDNDIKIVKSMGQRHYFELPNGEWVGWLQVPCENEPMNWRVDGF